LGTKGTVASNSYPIEIEKFFPELKVYQESCPMWVPLVENNEYHSIAADYFVKKNLDNLFIKSEKIDTIILGCTHYPLLTEKIKKYIPEKVTLLSQGELVAESLDDYLKRHPDMESRCSKSGEVEFFTSDSEKSFNEAATVFFGKEVKAKHLSL